MNIKPIIAVLSIAGVSHVLTGCDDLDDGLRILEGRPTKAQIAAEQSPQVSLHLASSAPVEPEPVVEPEPPAPVYERVCWIEWHRAGTMAVEVCENRLVNP